jgi:hypothetical protein
VAFAEAERDRIREPVLGTKADQKKRGRFLGGTTPFGWQVGEEGSLIEVPEQQVVIRQIMDLRRQGMSLRAIAAKIGGTVSHVTVRGILANADASGIGTIGVQENCQKSTGSVGTYACFRAAPDPDHPCGPYDACGLRVWSDNHKYPNVTVRSTLSNAIPNPRTRGYPVKAWRDR